ncbi:MAG: alpha/beta hydrolase [Treponema sp.]|nr:alpha/beta hydrolase [Treponema sp.]
MNDFTRENLSYFGLYAKMLRAQKKLVPEYLSFGQDKDQYLLYYAPEKPVGADAAVSDKTVLWVHGGGWNAGSPKFFDFVGQCIAGAGYPFVSLGYRLSPKNKYPVQISDVCAGYKAALEFLKTKGSTSPRIVVTGSSAGAHLSSILCYSPKAQADYGVDVSHIIGYIGIGGPYCFQEGQGWVLRTLLKQLFEKDYDRMQGEPCALMGKSSIPMLLIQSEHDGLIDYSCATRMAEKAASLGNRCELYPVVGKRNTHSWYTAGVFLETRKENATLDKFFNWIEGL